MYVRMENNSEQDSWSSFLLRIICWELPILEVGNNFLI